MKKMILILALAFAIFPAMVYAKDAPDNSCEVFADTMTKKVMALFHDGTKNEEQKKEALSSLFQQAVGTDWIGKFVLGHYWAATSPADKEEYLKVYKDYLTQVYISKFTENAAASVEDIKILSVKPDQGDDVLVKTVVSQKDQEDVPIDYLINNSNAKCEVHDIKVDGVSLLVSQRSEFSAIAGSKGVKGVTEAIKTKLAD